MTFFDNWQSRISGRDIWPIGHWIWYSAGDRILYSGPEIRVSVILIFADIYDTQGIQILLLSAFLFDCFYRKCLRRVGIFIYFFSPNKLWFLLLFVKIFMINISFVSFVHRKLHLLKKNIPSTIPYNPRKFLFLVTLYIK